MQKIKKFRDLLIKEKDELKMLSLKTKDSRAPVILDQQSVGRLSRMDAIQQQNMNLATETNRNNKISQIENTLKRIELGTFGICISCGEEISEKRLLIDPTVLKCIDCN
tara:strand:- start:6380 stop:6706 length:327 start_codon:yes stop_codon:yes gene_type:complete